MFRDIIRRFLPAVRRVQKLSSQQWKAVNSILLCRTRALGGELYACGNCPAEEKRWHSCRNRHCPICQWDAAKKWIARQKEKLLPVSYFHVVFTLPEELNQVFLYNREVLYDLFFKMCAETLQTFFADQRHVGAQGGFFGVLHTWGQRLQFHPHIHWVVPNGGLDGDGGWVQPKRPDGDRFLFPVRAVAMVFRGKLLERIEKLYRKGKLRFPDPQTELGFRDQLNMAAAKRWNIYAKRPFAGPMQVIQYLSHYTHRIAISPRRILKVTAETVTFRYKDYRDGAKKKTCTMDGDLFLRRFLLHVLPPRFRKIRHYGWLRGEVIKLRREELLAWFRKQRAFALTLTKLLADLSTSTPEREPCLCKKCKVGFLGFVRLLPPERKESKAAYG